MIASNMHDITHKQTEQECIPVGCVPSTAVAVCKQKDTYETRNKSNVDDLKQNENASEDDNGDHVGKLSGVLSVVGVNDHHDRVPNTH